MLKYSLPHSLWTQSISLLCLNAAPLYDFSWLCLLNYTVSGIRVQKPHHKNLQAPAQKSGSLESYSKVRKSLTPSWWPQYYFFVHNFCSSSGVLPKPKTSSFSAAKIHCVPTIFLKHRPWIELHPSGSLGGCNSLMCPANPTNNV